MSFPIVAKQFPYESITNRLEIQNFNKGILHYEDCKIPVRVLEIKQEQTGYEVKICYFQHVLNLKIRRYLQHHILETFRVNFSPFYDAYNIVKEANSNKAKFVKCETFEGTRNWNAFDEGRNYDHEWAWLISKNEIRELEDGEPYKLKKGEKILLKRKWNSYRSSGSEVKVYHSIPIKY